MWLRNQPCVSWGFPQLTFRDQAGWPPGPWERPGCVQGSPSPLWFPSRPAGLSSCGLSPFLTGSGPMCHRASGIPHPDAFCCVGRASYCQSRTPGTGTVVQAEVAPWLPVSAAPASAAAGLCFPSAALMLLPGVRAPLSRPVPCSSGARVIPGPRLVASGNAVPEDLLTSSPAAGVTLGTGLGGPAWTAEGNTREGLPVASGMGGPGQRGLPA